MEQTVVPRVTRQHGDPVATPELSEGEQRRYLELYKVFRDQNPKYDEHVRQHIVIWMQLILAVLGATLFAFYQFRERYHLVLIVLIGPLIGMVLCGIGAYMYGLATRQYMMIIVALAKLETVLGLNGPFSVLPRRWVDDWNDAKRDENTFIRKAMTALSHKVVFVPYYLLYAVNVALAGLVLIKVQWHSLWDS